MLALATAEAAQVFPVFVVDPALLERHAEAAGRLAWFAASVEALAGRLGSVGSGLRVLAGDPAAVLTRFASEVGADAIFAGRDEDPFAVARDEEVARRVDLRLVDDQRLLPPGALRTASGDAFRIFTPFRNALGARLAADSSLVAESVADVSRLARISGSLPNETFPWPAAAGRLPLAGELAAKRRLRSFVANDLRRYRAERDRPDLASTSGISPYLRTGALSVRAAWRAVQAVERDAELADDAELAASARRWRDELAWREFYAGVLLAHPEGIERGLRSEYRGIGWETGRAADDAFEAWRSGSTGIPIVDAGMRQLRATGWMHNRLRLITASFLVKDLGIDWRRGEAAFMEHLLDGDLSQNNGNWQWVAGVGTDAAPYFRILNPVLQGKRFDPQGDFVRAWLPELAELPTRFIHEPWLAPPGPRPTAYPAPIVEHAAARRRALERYRLGREEIGEPTAADLRAAATSRWR